MRLLILLVFVSILGCRATTAPPPPKQSNPASLDVPSEIDFGVVDTGSFKDTTLDLFNPGTETLHVLGQHFSSPLFSVDSSAFDVIGRVTHPLRFRYTSTDLNEHTPDDTIVTNVKSYIVRLRAKGGVPSDANDLLVAGTDQWVFLSTDRGYNWTPTNSITGFPSIVQVVTFKGAIYVRTSSDLYRSTDLGNSWTAVGLPNTDVTVMEAFDSIMLVGDSYADIYASSDGKSWTSRSVFGSINSFAKMTDSSRYFAAASNLYASITGKQWQDIISSVPYISTLGYHSPYIFAGEDNKGIYRLNETLMDHWQADSSGTPAQNNYYSFLATNSALFMLSSGGLLRTLDNGHMWFLLHPSNFPVSDLNASSVLKAVHGEILLGCNSGIYRSSDNGMTWTVSNAGLTYKQVNSIVVLHRP